MTTRADVDRLNQASRRLVTLAQQDLESIFNSLNLTDPAAVRDELLEIVPRLTAQYGDLAATAAAEWFEQLRDDQLGGQYTARLGDTIPVPQVQDTTRWAAGKLWGNHPVEFLAAIAGPLQRLIYYSARDTVRRNVATDPGRPRYARVPTGAHTCAFCEMLASRGFVYHTKTTAGMFDKFHDDCDCQIVPEWDQHAAHIDGYDPDAMHARFLHAQREAGTGNTDQILAQMRRLYPDAYSDGVHTP